jgi:hypothetical protein
VAASVKEKVPGDDQLLKLWWIQFMQLSLAVHTKQPGMLPDKHATHNSAQNSAKTFEIKVISTKCCNM